MKSLYQLIQYLFSVLLSALSNASDIVDLIFRLPMRVLNSGRQDDDGDAYEDAAPTSVFQRTAQILLSILLAPFRLLGWASTIPFHFWLNSSSDRQRDLLFGTPAIIAAGVVLLLLIRSEAMSNNTAELYRYRAIESFREGDYPMSNVYFSRLILDNRTVATKFDRLNWARSLKKSGQIQKAAAILDELAPDKKPGFDEAHQLKAFDLIQSARDTKQDTDFLDRLRFHLTHGGGADSPEVNEAWSIYYLAIGQFENAIEHLKLAVKKDSSHLLAIAELYRQLGNEPEMEAHFKLAADNLYAKLQQVPLDQSVRISLAKALTKLSNFDAAARVLESGFRMKPDKELQAALAGFYVHRFDRQTELEFPDRFGFLNKSLKYDVNYLPAYDRLIACYSNSKSETEIQEIQNYLSRSLAEGNAPSLCHFALSNIEWLAGRHNKAQWHIEKAFKIDSQLAAIANNLAWMLAHSPTPDLERALVLAKGVVSKSPNDFRFRDTLATVLMLSEEYDEAAAEFEKILKSSPNRRKIHRNLATIYHELGHEEISKQHKKLAQADPLEP